jgi:hypothetical protein
MMLDWMDPVISVQELEGGWKGKAQDKVTTTKATIRKPMMAILVAGNTIINIVYFTPCIVTHFQQGQVSIIR